MKFPRKRFVIGFLVGLALIMGAADFHRFVRRVGALEKPVSPQADAIVALTGGSGKRIEAAIILLEDKAGARLLVSGVHESVNTSDLISAAGGSDALFTCCIDIGHEATSTEENATETANWAESKQYDSLILVTSDYHMPRARLWFKRSLPEVEIIPFPMQSRLEPKNWWRSWKSFRGLATEWAKYRVTALLLAF